jgi:tetratricopeptide (TPR) repeat protein
MKRVLPAALLAASVACTVMTPPPNTRFPQPSDFMTCYARALEFKECWGKLTIQAYVLPTGVLAGSWIRNTTVDSDILERCVAASAVETWNLEARGEDFFDYYGPVVFTPPTSSLGSASFAVTPPDASQTQLESFGDLEIEQARRSLQIAPWATDADRGWIEYALGDTKASEALFRKAIAADPKSVSALRGLAQSLVAAGGDLKEARSAAEKAVELAPGLAGAHEALSRACLAAADLDCATEHFNQATKIDTKGVRGYELLPLQKALIKADEEDRAKRGLKPAPAPGAPPAPSAAPTPSPAPVPTPTPAPK